MGMVAGKTRCTSKSCVHHQTYHVAQTAWSLINAAAQSHPANALMEGKLVFLRVGGEENVYG